MPLLINDEQVADEIIAQRQATGGDRYDEVWEGVYVMSPIANNEHQSLVTELSIAIGTVIDWKGLGRTLAGANVSDRRDDWTQNYRVPDVLVFLNETEAIDCNSHWLGGPDFAIEIVSPGDNILRKLDFYAAVGTRELLVVDRHPWSLTLYRLAPDRKLKPVAISSPTQETSFASSVLPIHFQWCNSPSSILLTSPEGQKIHSIAIELSDRGEKRE